MDEPVIVLAKFQPLDGNENTVLEILKEMVEPSRNESGNVFYNLYKNKVDQSEKIEFCLFEKYKDEKALDEHRETEHYKAYRAKIMDHLKAPIGVTVLSTVDAID